MNGFKTFSEKSDTHACDIGHISWKTIVLFSASQSSLLINRKNLSACLRLLSSDVLISCTTKEI